MYVCIYIYIYIYIYINTDVHQGRQIQFRETPSSGNVGFEYEGGNLVHVVLEFSGLCSMTEARVVQEPPQNCLG